MPTTKACWPRRKSDLKRFQTLGRQDSIAQQQLDDQRFLVQQYTGTVQTDQGAVDTAKVNLAYCHIVSPIDGQVGLRQVDQGNYVQTSSTTGLVVIAQIQPISVIFAVPEDNLPDIIQRLRAGATLPSRPRTGQTPDCWRPGSWGRWTVKSHHHRHAQTAGDVRESG